MKKLTIKPSPLNLAVFKENDRYDCDDDGNGVLHHLVIIKAPLCSVKEAVTRLKLTPHTFNKALKTPIDIAIEQSQTDVAEYLLSLPIEVDEGYLEWMLGTLLHHCKEAKDMVQQHNVVGYFASRIAGDGFSQNNTHSSWSGFKTNALWQKYHKKYLGHLHWLEGKSLITEEKLEGFWLGVFLPLRINVMLRLWLESYLKKPTPEDYTKHVRLHIKNIVAEIKRDLQTLWIERYGQKIEKHPFREHFLNALHRGIMGSIKQLPEYSGIILYTGWEKHALYTVIKCLPAQQYQLTVHNLGEGASWHQEKIEGGVTKNYPYSLGMVDASAFDNMGIGFIYIKNVLNALFPKQPRVIVQKVIYDKDNKASTQMNTLRLATALSPLCFEPLRQQTVGNCVLANHDASRHILIPESVRDWLFREERAMVGKIDPFVLKPTIDDSDWRLEIFPLQRVELQWAQKPPALQAQVIKWCDKEGDILPKGSKPFCIGQGGFGDVYLATYGKEYVAVKELRLGKLVPTQEDKMALYFEAVMQAQCSHFPNILRLFGLCRDLTQANSIALVTEYAPLGDLQKVLSDKKIELPWPVRWQIAIDISSGLCYLHDLNILHRDLKSTNIGIFKDFTAKIMDFGHAKMSDLYSRSVGTQGLSLQTAGATLKWSAPETLEDSYKFSPPADIYSLGMILWEIATREQPFGSQQNPVIIMAKISQGQLDDIPPITPKDFSEMIAETRKFKSFERPTAEQLQKRLKENFDQFKRNLLVCKLLLHVAQGEQDEAEALIKADRSLLLFKGTVTDYSGRTFENITAFQYALWALDWHMWTMLMRYLPEDVARAQLQELETQGTEYGKHYDSTPLLQAYEKLKEAYDEVSEEWPKRAYDQLVESVSNDFRIIIGQHQTQVPAHVAQEYCRPELPINVDNYFILGSERAIHGGVYDFTKATTDAFNEASFSRSLKIGTDEKEAWYPLTQLSYGSLGIDFAVEFRGYGFSRITPPRKETRFQPRFQFQPPSPSLLVTSVLPSVKANTFLTLNELSFYFLSARCSRSLFECAAKYHINVLKELFKIRTEQYEELKASLR